MPETIFKDRTTFEDWHQFVVEGRADFPFDMLRHSTAWPTTSADACAIGAHGKRRVMLTTCLPRHVSAARWDSFGWKIVAGYEMGWPTVIEDHDAAVLETA